MQHFQAISQCVGCDHRIVDADPRRACPRCGSAMLALPEELVARGERFRGALAGLLARVPHRRGS